MLSKSGVTGKTITVIISLIIAFIALILLWTFLTKATPLISKTIENTIEGFRDLIAKKLGIKWIFDIGKWWGNK